MRLVSVAAALLVAAGCKEPAMEREGETEPATAPAESTRTGGATTGARATLDAAVAGASARPEPGPAAATGASSPDGKTLSVPANTIPSVGADPHSPEVPLAEAVKGLKTKGTLTAKIDVEAAGLKGSFLCELYDDKAPHTVANFIALARGLRPWHDPRSGQWVKRPFYDGLIFHRVMPDFMIQGGDIRGDGTGDPGYEFADETRPELGFDKSGLLGMSNRGPATNGSQFFITEKALPFLNGRYTLFGHCDNPDLEHRIARVPVAGRNKPVADVVIKKVTIVRAPRS